MSTAKPRTPIAELSASELRQRLLNHPLYESIDSVDGLRLFMREHVFAVWDFMSLLKRLQQLVTCCAVPWLPPADASLARFINEIVVGEECDEDGQGGFASHFELYLSAMDQVGADSRPIRQFLAELKAGDSVSSALSHAQILPQTKQFVLSTLSFTSQGSPHEVAAAFFYGREDVIPEMFARLVKSLPARGIAVERMAHYLNRHIELDAEDHGPLASRMLDRLCDQQPIRKQQAEAAASAAIRQRILLWDGILEELKSGSISHNNSDG